MNLSETIAQGENKTLEFKERMPSNESIAKTVVAFANTSGGRLIVGVNDRREVVGLEDVDIFDLQDRITSVIFDRCHPTILPEIYSTNIDNKLLLVIQVFRGNLLPYYLKSEGKNNGTYLRLGATNRKAEYENILELERQKRNLGFDEEICYERAYESLDISVLIDRFSQQGKAFGLEQLQNFKLVKLEQEKLYPTHGLLILLGLYPHATIKCARFKGKSQDMRVFVDRKEYEGDLFQQLDSAEGFIKNHLHLQGEIRGLQRTDTYEIPLEALREALVNAIIHRDYSNLGRDIKLAVYDDTVNVLSPGGFPSMLLPEEAMAGRSEIRNRCVARIFKELGYIEQWGSGIRRIKQSCTSQGLIEPLIWEKGDFVEVEFYRASDGLRRITADYGGLSADECSVMNILVEQPKITTKDIKQVLNVGDTKAKDLLKNLMNKQRLQRQGSGRSTYYIQSDRS
jgi:ATP-dependent DNA helicase RecG